MCVKSDFEVRTAIFLDFLMAQNRFLIILKTFKNCINSFNKKLSINKSVMVDDNHSKIIDNVWQIFRGSMAVRDRAPIVYGGAPKFDCLTLALTNIKL